MLPDPDQAAPRGRPGLRLALSLACVAPAVAWAAHALLGLQLEPGRWTGWASGAAGGVLAWLWSLVWPWVWVLALAPVLEELAMRPLLQTGLHHQLDRIHPAWPGHPPDWRGHLANAGTALVFALLHMPANGMLALWWLLPALAIGEVWRRSASWRLCALLHAWFNVSLVAVTLFFSLQ